MSHPELDSSTRTSIVGGFYGDFGGIGLAAFHLQAEVLWSTKGFTNGTVQGLDENGQPESYTLDLRNTYFQFPILFAYHFSTPGTIKPRIYAGPTFNVLKAAEIKDSDTSDFILRYEWGLTSLGDLSPRQPESTSDAKAKDRTFKVMIGVPFN